jgi:hypothetical protein
MKAKNEMTREECRMSFPKSKWFQPVKSATMKAEIPEADLQAYADDAIALRGWSVLRFPDAFMGWFKYNAPPWIQKIFFGQIGGRMPDDFIMVQIGQGLFLSLKLELKTQDKKGRAVGTLHGRQKAFARMEGWKIARSPKEIDAVLDGFQKIVEKVKKMLAQSMQM